MAGGIDLIGKVRDLWLRLSDVYNAIQGTLVLTETGGSVTTTGAEQTLYINDAPAGVYRPIKLQLDTGNMVGGDVTVVRTYYRITPGATIADMKKDEVTFNGAQAEEIKNIELEPNRYGILVTIQRTVAGDRAYPWAVFWEA